MAETKTCKDCGEVLPLDKFIKHSYYKKNGEKTISNLCKDCNMVRIRNCALRKGLADITEKSCNKCKEIKSVDHFYFFKCIGRFTTVCKECSNSDDYEKNKEKREFIEKNTDESNSYCKKCDEIKSVDHFYLNKKTGNYDGYCKPCKIEYRIERYGNTSYDKDYFEKNKDRIYAQRIYGEK